MFSSVCFLLSDSLPPLDLKSTWYVQAKPDWKKFYEQIYKSGCDRLSQVGKDRDHERHQTLTGRKTYFLGSPQGSFFQIV